MAVAFKCDLCGRLYESYDGITYDERDAHFNRIVLSNDAFNRYWDACPNCMRATIDFMKARKEMNKTDKAGY